MDQLQHAPTHPLPACAHASPSCLAHVRSPDAQPSNDMVRDLCARSLTPSSCSASLLLTASPLPAPVLASPPPALDFKSPVDRLMGGASENRPVSSHAATWRGEAPASPVSFGVTADGASSSEPSPSLPNPPKQKSPHERVTIRVPTTSTASGRATQLTARSTRPAASACGTDTTCSRALAQLRCVHHRRPASPCSRA